MSGFTEEDVGSQAGKTILVTGANTGLGFEVARVFAGKGARVLMGCRNAAKAQAARDRIVELHSAADVELVSLDLGSLQSVRSAAAVVSQEPRLDVLVNNAGIMMPPRSLTADGFESQLGVNHLGPFALTGLLLEKLLATEGSRIVATSSNAHKGASMYFDDLQAERSYSKLGRYGQSKLANLLHTFELNKRLRASGASTLAVAAHPGGSATDLARDMPFVRMAIPLLGFILNTAAQGAWPTLMAAVGPDVEGGDYYGPSRFFEVSGPARKVMGTAKSRDPKLAAQLWDVSVQLTGVDPKI